MSQAAPRASVDLPYLATTPDAIEQSLASAKAPLDTACGLLATDPALLLHLLHRSAESHRQGSKVPTLRELAGQWLQSSNHRWYTEIVPVAHSRLSDEQQREHQRLCARSTLAAGLIGEWANDGVAALEGTGDLAEMQVLLAVLPSLMLLCRIDSGAAHPDLNSERAAWFEEACRYLGKDLAKGYRLLQCEQDGPVSAAVEIAAAVLSPEGDSVVPRKLPEWSRRLSRSADKLSADIDRVREGMQSFDLVSTAMTQQQLHQLARVGGESAQHPQDCEGCRQQAFDNALHTVRNRLQQPGLHFNEVLDHLLHALCNCGSLRRAHWYCLSEDQRSLHSSRRKLAADAKPLPTEALQIEQLPLLQVLMERPRSVQVSPDIRDQLQQLLPQSVPEPFGQHYLCASVYCGTTPLGLLYADGDGDRIGAAEAARFKSVVQLASKLVTLLALRSQGGVKLPETSQLRYPDYAVFVDGLAANDWGEASFTEAAKGSHSPRR